MLVSTDVARFAAGIAIGVLAAHGWSTKDSDSTLPPGCEHIAYSNGYVTAQFGEFNIYLPPGYADNSDTYPVAYHLHGLSNTEWTDLPMAYELDSLIRDARIEPMIAVWCNISFDGAYVDVGPGEMQASYLIKGLMPYIDSEYRTNGLCGISGFSMGGIGSLRFAFSHARERLFCGVVDYDGAVRTYDTSPFNPIAFARDSSQLIREAELVIRMWAEGQDFNGDFLQGHAVLDSILTDQNIAHAYDTVYTGHVGVLGEFTTDTSKHRRIADPSRIIEGYCVLDSAFKKHSTHVSRFGSANGRKATTQVNVSAAVLGGMHFSTPPGVQKECAVFDLTGRRAGPMRRAGSPPTACGVFVLRK